MAPRVITDLISHRLHQLATMSSLSASMRYERKFGLSLLEWRSIAMLGGFAPLSLKELARRAGLDKSYASRTVSALIERGWVVSEKNDVDGRGVMLSLSDTGRALYQKVFPDAVARNDRMLSVLKPAQRRQLIELLTLLAVGARRLLDDERRARVGAAPDAEAAATPRRAKRATASAVTPPYDIDELRYLVTRMNELLGPRPR